MKRAIIGNFVDWLCIKCNNNKDEEEKIYNKISEEINNEFFGSFKDENNLDFSGQVCKAISEKLSVVYGTLIKNDLFSKEKLDELSTILFSEAEENLMYKLNLEEVLKNIPQDQIKRVKIFYGENQEEKHHEVSPICIEFDCWNGSKFRFVQDQSHLKEEKKHTKAGNVETNHEVEEAGGLNDDLDNFD